MPNNNILKCNICKKHLIFEEVNFITIQKII